MHLLEFQYGEQLILMKKYMFPRFCLPCMAVMKVSHATTRAHPRLIFLEHPRATV